MVYDCATIYDKVGFKGPKLTVLSVPVRSAFEIPWTKENAADPRDTWSDKAASVKVHRGCRMRGFVDTYWQKEFDEGYEFDFKGDEIGYYSGKRGEFPNTGSGYDFWPLDALSSWYCICRKSLSKDSDHIHT